MTKWAGSNGMYVFIRSDYAVISARRYVACYMLSHTPCLRWKHRATLVPRCCHGVTVLIRIKAVRHVDWEIPDKFRGKEGGWSVGSLDR